MDISNTSFKVFVYKRGCRAVKWYHFKKRILW